LLWCTVYCVLCTNLGTRHFHTRLSNWESTACTFSGRLSSVCTHCCCWDSGGCISADSADSGCSIRPGPGPCPCPCNCPWPRPWGGREATNAAWVSLGSGMGMAAAAEALSAGVFIRLPLSMATRKPLMSASAATSNTEEQPPLRPPDRPSAAAATCARVRWKPTASSSLSEVPRALAPLSAAALSPLAPAPVPACACVPSPAWRFLLILCTFLVCSFMSAAFRTDTAAQHSTAQHSTAHVR
jgi:hypothetical protein